MVSMGLAVRSTVGSWRLLVGVVLVDVLEGYTYRTMSTMGEYAI